MMPFSCAASSASAICRAIASASSSGSGPQARTIGQRRPFDELHHEGADAVGHFKSMNRGDVRVVQGREQLRFALDARHELGAICQRSRQDLDRHLAMKSRVEGAIHLTHAAGIERRQNAVGAELDPCGQRRHGVERQRRSWSQAVDGGALGKRSRIGVRRRATTPRLL